MPSGTLFAGGLSKELTMFIVYIVLGAFVVGAGAVASANLSGNTRRR